MNEILLYDVGTQKHIETVRRAERKAGLPRPSGNSLHPVRRRIAAALVSLASRLQPGLRCELPQPIQPATA